MALQCIFQEQPVGRFQNASGRGLRRDPLPRRRPNAGDRPAHGPRSARRPSGFGSRRPEYEPGRNWPRPRSRRRFGAHPLLEQPALRRRGSRPGNAHSCHGRAWLGRSAGHLPAREGCRGGRSNDRFAGGVKKTRSAEISRPTVPIRRTSLKSSGSTPDPLAVLQISWPHSKSAGLASRFPGGAQNLPVSRPNRLAALPIS